LIVSLPESSPVEAANPGEYADGDLDVLIHTDLDNPVAVELAKSLLDEAGIPYFGMDQNPTARQESGKVFNYWWDVRLPSNREAAAREILASITNPT
jgi:hypothetical protein